MDYSQFRRSNNVDQPNPLDYLLALLSNPLNSQWQQQDENGYKVPKMGPGQTAAEFPTFPPADPRMANSPLAQSLGSNQISPPIFGPELAELLKRYGL